ncbi:MAG: superoxide dismutase [Ilumatobacteraceae bacterium]
MTDRYTLPDLPYGYDALEPWCPAETLHLHHGKHHAAYVHGANEAAVALDAMDPADTYQLAGAQTALTFNLGGHVLHSLFWLNLSPDIAPPSGVLATQINTDFGSMARLHDLLTAACMGVQGSGWGALMYDSVSGTLRATALRDHQHELVAGTTVLAVVDVWEHAYYLTNQNDRAAWVQSVIDHLDWQTVARRFTVASKKISPTA